MSKPPPSTPHSDLDGVHEDERRNVDSAGAAGESGEALKRAADNTVARPPYSVEPSGDDRSG